MTFHGCGLQVATHFSSVKNINSTRLKSQDSDTEAALRGGLGQKNTGSDRMDRVTGRYGLSNSDSLKSFQLALVPVPGV